MVDAPIVVRIYTPATRAASRAGESLRVERQFPDALADQASSEQPQPASHTDQAAAGADKPPFSWMRLIGWSIAAVMLGVIILAGARIVADHPWAAAVVGASWALYLKYRKA